MTHACCVTSRPSTAGAVRDITNNGKDASFTINGDHVSVSKNGQSVNITGTLQNGNKFELAVTGDPHLRYTETDARTGAVVRNQRFDFKEDSAFKLSDGTVVAIGTKGNGWTLSDRIAVISKDGTASVVKNIASPENLQVNTQRITGNPLEFLNREIAPDGSFDGNLYRVTARGLETTGGKVADQCTVNEYEGRNNRVSQQELAYELLGRGLRPRGCYGGMVNVDDFTNQLQSMGAFGGLMPLCDAEGNRVLLQMQGYNPGIADGYGTGYGMDGSGYGMGMGGYGMGMGGYGMGMDGEEQCCDDCFGSYLNQMPQWQPAPWSMNSGMACSILSNYLRGTGELQTLAKQGPQMVQQAARYILAHPNLHGSISSYGSGPDGLFTGGRNPMAGIAAQWGYQ